MSLRNCAFVLAALAVVSAAASEAAIQPWPENPRYWQYEGAPVLLLGASETDHIFLLDKLEEHLDEIADAGVNYVRCTMSQREGAEFKPHLRLEDGCFDLEQWNPAYWQRFDECLRLCRERGIVLQLELWDRFDYSQQEWQASAWRPANNMNYSTASSGLADAYPQPAWRDRQPFFHTLPGLPLHDPRLEEVLAFQEAFADKVLEHTLPFGNVLYSISNEGSAPMPWSLHFAERLRRRAREVGKTIYITEMLDAARITPVIEHPDAFNYIEVSKLFGPRRQDWAPQGQAQYEAVRSVYQATSEAPRPLNLVKIICNQDEQIEAYSVRKFCRAVFSGVAAVRFHREPAGLGATPAALRCASAVRKTEALCPLWRLAPRQDLLREREADEAYCLAHESHGYALFFPNGGQVALDLSAEQGTWRGRWISVSTGEAGPSFEAGAGGAVTIAAPGAGPWLVALTPAAQAR